MNIRRFEQAVIVAELAGTGVELSAVEARWLLDELKRLHNAAETCWRYRLALEEIAKGEGAVKLKKLSYSFNRHERIVENMKEHAQRALSEEIGERSQNDIAKEARRVEETGG